MKLQLDTTKKEIKVEENVLLAKFVKTLNALLPNGEWKNYTLQTNTVIEHFHRPTIIREYPTYPYSWPWYSGTSGSYVSKADAINRMEVGDNTMLANSTSALTLKSGIYNVDVKA